MHERKKFENGSLNKVADIVIYLSKNILSILEYYMEKIITVNSRLMKFELILYKINNKYWTIILFLIQHDFATS